MVCVAAGERNERVVLLPQLRAGDALRYESHARLDRHVETKSSVAMILQPARGRQDLSAALRVSVGNARVADRKLLLDGETELRSTDANGTAEGPSPAHRVRFAIAGDGSLAKAEGLDDLAPGDALLWQFWAAQFAFEWTLPAAGVKPGEKWKSEEVEKTPAPIANLVWEREITYVENDKCPVAEEQQCAVFLVSSTLKQKSNPKDTTPEDYRIRELKTSGTAKGTNETVVYISLQTGLLVRATEDVEQLMSVTVAKSDGSNQVHYDMSVTSHFETALKP